MARPIKEGLDYFPLDTDIIHDIKIRKIMRSNGPQSIAVLLDLLGNIYGDHGYYMKWDDDVRFLVADDVGISEAAVDELVNKAIHVDFFDETLFKKYSILTSKGIQKRYQKASKRKSGFCIQKPYNLLVNVYNNPPQGEVNDDNNSHTSEVSDAESTRKESKEKESKENNIKDSVRKEFTLEVWPKFPKKQKFESAFEAYVDGLNSGATKDQIIDGIERYKKYLHVKHKEDGYTANPDTWLENKRWMDEYDMKPEQPGPKGQKVNQKETLPDWANDDQPKPPSQQGLTPEQQAQLDKQLAALKRTEEASS
ncbi:DnaD domain protein [Lentilactobacillus rapi DSM 19907 = JCM 15042]|uniref:Lin1244/Lin1753-like N-terminal domain-containing protein n=3 Tax=Lactobacillaceae TaxID=33958 RepID=A0A512PLC2_9LACO|nr:DUF4373 domain-containing protein [Lentilactobacillus rapi]KRL17649.1 DnaD domain protein [Lentilactobacillus rapi DSM 19907 = JCM 15042]GEP71995.1 hypothetical protein LRA02_08630 [Lentilactobacillus rapi]